MPHYAVFHMGLHCFPTYPFRGFYMLMVKLIFGRQLSLLDVLTLSAGILNIGLAQKTLQ